MTRKQLVAVLVCIFVLHVSAFELTINPKQFDALLDETKSIVNEAVKSVDNSVLAFDKTTDKVLLSVDGTTHAITNSMLGTFNTTLLEVRHAFLNVTDQVCTTAQQIQKGIATTAGSLNGELIATAKTLLGDTLATINHLAAEFRQIANTSIAETRAELVYNVRARAVDIGKVIIGSAFFFGFIMVISKLIPRMPHRAKFSDYCKSFFPMSTLVIIITCMLCAVDHMWSYTEDSPAVFQPLLIHITMASNIVAATNVYLYLVCVVAFEWDHPKLHMVVTGRNPNISINDNEDDEIIEITDPKKTKKYKIKKREYWWQLVLVWFVRFMMMIAFTVLLAGGLFLIGYMAKRRVQIVKSRPDYREFDM